MQLYKLSGLVGGLLLQLGPVLGSPLTSPAVHLGYASYEGVRSLDGVDQYLGMRYAAPPLKENRFKLPQQPEAERGIRSAKEVCAKLPLAYAECSLTLT